MYWEITNSEKEVARNRSCLALLYSEIEDDNTVIKLPEFNFDEFDEMLSEEFHHSPEYAPYSKNKDYSESEESYSDYNPKSSITCPTFQDVVKTVLIVIKIYRYSKCKKKSYHVE